MNDINSHLAQLYKEKFNTGNPCFLELLRAYRRKKVIYKPTYPLMLKVDEKRVAEADIKIMIFGQETNSWEFKVSQTTVAVNQSHAIVDETVDAFTDKYSHFFYKEYHRSPFWHGIYRIKRNIHNLMPTKKVEYIWNNVYKIGNMLKNQNRPSSDIIRLQDKNFNVITKEIDILQPNILIFLTGYHYDNRLYDLFTVSQKASINHINPYELMTFKSDNLLSYRTYHPNYLRWAKKTYYLDIICEDIKNVITGLNI